MSSKHSLANEDKKIGITILARNIETAEYPYISACKQHDFRSCKTRVLLACNQGSNLFADGNVSNVMVMYNFWREHEPRHFRLDMINREQFLAFIDASNRFLLEPRKVLPAGGYKV